MKYLLYDNECPFCCSIVRKISSLAKNLDISYEHIRSKKGKELIEKYYLENIDSVIYIENKSVFIKSSAILRLCKQMRFPYNLCYIFNVFPESLLDLGYNFIAKNRLKIKI